MDDDNQSLADAAILVIVKNLWLLTKRINSSEQILLAASLWLIGSGPAALQHFNFVHMPEALGIQNYFVAGGENGLIEELPEREIHFHGVVLLRCRPEVMRNVSEDTDVLFCCAVWCCYNHARSHY